MDIDEAIRRCEDIIQEQKNKLYRMEKYDDLFREEKQECYKCLKEHEQLAEWLKELKAFKELFDSVEDAKQALNSLMT